MDIKRIFIFIALFSVFALPSCKKEKDDEIDYKNSFSGSLLFSIPEYVAPGDTYIVTPSGLTRSDDKEKGIGIYWDCPELYIKKLMTRKEEDPLDKKGELTVNIIDSIGTVALKCTAFADDFYSATASRSFVIVSPKNSLKYSDVAIGTRRFTDTRDKQVYTYKRIGNRDWMLRNLAYAGAGKPYHDCKAMDPIYGRYYTWEEAMEVCPEGWRLPDEEDWNDLYATVSEDKENPAKGIAGSMMVTAYFNGDKLWEFWPEVKITNKASFSALPAGYATISGDHAKYTGSLEYAAFWTADEMDEEQAIYNYLYMKNPDLMVGSAHKNSFAASVRCVRD